MLISKIVIDMLKKKQQLKDDIITASLNPKEDTP